MKRIKMKKSHTMKTKRKRDDDTVDEGNTHIQQVYEMLF